MAVLIALGLFVLVVSIAPIARFLKPRARNRRKALRAAIVEIAKVTPGQIARVRGKVVSCGEKIALPFVGGDGVLHSTTVTQEDRFAGSHETFGQEHCRFLVEDRSGSVRIDAHVPIDLAAEPPREALSSRHPELARYVGEVMKFGTVTKRQTCVRDGDEILVYGRLVRVADVLLLVPASPNVGIFVETT